MKTLKSILFFVLFVIMTSCGQTDKQSKSFKVFNEGVSYSLDATIELEKGNFENAIELNTKAIDKFLEMLQIDSTHKMALGALGHSYYMIRDYQKGIEWYEKANMVDTNNVANYLEYGLCLINLGDLSNGNSAIEKAISIDNSKASIDHAVYNLLDIGTLAFDYGKEYDKQGDKEEGQAYKEFSIAVLLIAHHLDTTNQEVIRPIIDFSEKIGYAETAEEFKNKVIN